MLVSRLVLAAIITWLSLEDSGTVQETWIFLWHLCLLSEASLSQKNLLALEVLIFKPKTKQMVLEKVLLHPPKNKNLGYAEVDSQERLCI